MTVAAYNTGQAGQIVGGVITLTGELVDMLPFAQTVADGEQPAISIRKPGATPPALAVWRAVFDAASNTLTRVESVQLAGEFADGDAVQVVTTLDVPSMQTDIDSRMPKAGGEFGGEVAVPGLRLVPDADGNGVIRITDDADMLRAAIVLRHSGVEGSSIAMYALTEAGAPTSGIGFYEVGNRASQWALVDVGKAVELFRDGTVDLVGFGKLRAHDGLTINTLDSADVVRVVQQSGIAADLGIASWSVHATDALGVPHGGLRVSNDAEHGATVWSRQTDGSYATLYLRRDGTVDFAGFDQLRFANGSDVRIDTRDEQGAPSANIWLMPRSATIPAQSALQVYDAQGNGVAGVGVFDDVNGFTAFAGSYYLIAGPDGSLVTNWPDLVKLTHIAVSGSVDLDALASAVTALGVDKLNAALLGVANGVAELDESGRVPAAQLPGFVDDVVEYADVASFPPAGESGKLYIDLDGGGVYRWTGSAYVQTNAGGGGLVLGTTSSTAHRGDQGSAAYAHSLQTGNPHETTAEQVGADAAGTAANAVAQHAAAADPHGQYARRAEVVFVNDGNDLNPADGGVHVVNLIASRDFSSGVRPGAGESITLKIFGGNNYAITWPFTQWIGGAAPVFSGSSFGEVVVLWSDHGYDLNGMYVGALG